MKTDYIFLCDVDGTLIRRDVPLTTEVIDAARAYTTKGGLLALCTGRSVVAAKEVAKRIGVNLPCILCGGAVLYDFSTDTPLRIHGFRPEVRDGIAMVLERHADVSMQVYTGDGVYVLRRNGRLNARGIPEENQGEERLLGEITGDIIKLVMCCDDAEELGSCSAYFPDDYCDFAFSSRYFVDVVAKGCGKQDAMRALSEQFAVPFDRFFCAGDGMTDLPILELAGVSFAPANALDAVKASADYIVPDVKESGIAEAFRIAANYLDKE